MPDKLSPICQGQSRENPGAMLPLRIHQFYRVISLALYSVTVTIDYYRNRNVITVI
jgi:hypothetical protein